MKKEPFEDFIENAKKGYLTKDEYRDLQESLRSDQNLAEMMNGIMLQEDFNGLYHSIISTPSEFESDASD